MLADKKTWTCFSMMKIMIIFQLFRYWLVLSHVCSVIEQALIVRNSIGSAHTVWHSVAWSMSRPPAACIQLEMQINKLADSKYIDSVQSFCKDVAKTTNNDYNRILNHFDTYHSIYQCTHSSHLSCIYRVKKDNFIDAIHCGNCSCKIDRCLTNTTNDYYGDVLNICNLIQFDFIDFSLRCINWWKMKMVHFE